MLAGIIGAAMYGAVQAGVDPVFIAAFRLAVSVILAGDLLALQRFLVRSHLDYFLY